MVFAIAHGTVTREELYQYQEETWIENDTHGYNCLFDATSADFSEISTDDLVSFTKRSVEIDKEVSNAMLAIIASRKHEEDLARFYHSSVESLSNGNRKTKICKSMLEAMDWVTFGDRFSRANVDQ